MASRTRLLLLVTAACGTAALLASPTTVRGADGSGVTATTAPDCPVAAFPSLTASPANGRWPAPVLEVSCTADQVVVVSNGIPAYAFRQTTPADLRTQSYEWRFPRAPELADESTPIPLLGPAAIAVNGLPIYGPNEGEFPDPYGDPVFNRILDDCLGHTARRGDYHYHALLVACLTQGARADAPSPVIGWSFDGFAIYGSMGCRDAECNELTEYISGWRQSGDPTTYAWDNHEYVASSDPRVLDECNGHTGPAGDYHYHATDGFPYVLGCYSGFVDPSALGPGGESRRGVSRRPGPRTIRQ